MNENMIKKDMQEIETINIELDHRVSKLIAENEHLKQTYKQLYDLIKPTRVQSKEQCDALVNQVNQKSVKISDLNVSLQEKVLVITALKNELRKLKGKDLADNVASKNIVAPEMFKINVEPITPRLLNNRTTHSGYLRHTQEQAAILREVVEQGKSQNPLNNSLDSTCKYTKLIQYLLIIIRQTYPSINNSSDKLVAVTPKNKDKRVRFTESVPSSGNTNSKTTSSSNLFSNKPMLSSTGVKPSTSASGSQPSGNTKKDKIQQTSSSTQKNTVEAYPRIVKSSLKNKNSVVKPKGKENVQHSKLNANSEPLCVKCNGCMLFDNYDLCVLDFINDVNARAKSKSVKKSSKRKVWKTTGKVITTTAEVPLMKPIALETDTPKPIVTLVYSRKPKKSKTIVPVSKSKIIKSISANKKEPSKSLGSIVSNVPSSSLNECRSSKLFSVKFGNDHVEKILGYGDYQIGNVTISRVYYVEGLGHNLFSVGQFCDSNLEVAFRQHTCFIRNLEGVDLLTGTRGNNLYTLSLRDMMASSPICLLLKASKTKSWLWHRRLSHLNFGKSKKKPHKPKSEDTNQEKLYLLHMDLCGPMRVASVNGKKTDNGTEFVNQTLREYYEKVGISHETSAALAIACYTQNRSFIRLRHGKTPYELLHDKPHDLSFFHGFDALFYPTNDSENLGKLQPKVDIGIFIGYAPTKKAFRIYNQRTRRIIETIHVDFDELTAMASEHSSSEPVLHEMTPTTISLGLVPNPPPSPPFIPPSRSDWDLLFQLLFDELLTPPLSVVYPAPEVVPPIHEVVAPVPVVSTGSPSSTNVDQDAPSPSDSQTTPETQPPVIPNDVEEDNHDIKVAHMGNDPYFGILIPEVHSDQSSSSDIIHIIVHLDHQISEHNSKWTKDHPLKNIIDELARPVSTRLQLHEQALFCYYDAFLTTVEPMAYKDALTQSCWIKAMQEELNEFERLGVWTHGYANCREITTGMEDPQGKAVDPTHYRGMIGTLMYLTASRPDLTFVVCMCARYQAKPTEKHLYAVKRIFKYLRGTVNRGLRLVSWSSKRQKSIAISNTKAEYIAIYGCCAQILWMISQLTDYGLEFNKIPMYCDNKSTIALCCNNV
ncbi:retrovirus-related pol polyprotein from transposon TNT 1-94 [Tanacetum coccineum]